MLKGTIKFFQKTKGFGFITPDDGNNEVFLPAAAISAADLPKLKPGLRVVFEQVPDGKGPKAVSLKLLDDGARRPTGDSPPAGLTLLYDPSSPASGEVLEELKTLDRPARLVDYIASPPGHDELKRLSLMLGGTGQSLVRRHDPLFLALQLDDRFITEGEFWTAISQHPVLVNGPILVAADRASVCKTRDDARSFVGLGRPKKEEQKPKVISARLAAMMKGEIPPAPPAPPEEDIAKPPGKRAETGKARPVTKPRKTGAAPRPKPKAVAKAAPKTAATPRKAVKKKR